MSRLEDSYYNPRSRTRMAFVERPADNGGARVVIDWLVEPGEALVGTPHYHAGPDGLVVERFDLLAGNAACTIGRRRERADAPHTFDIPANTVHVHPRNIGPATMHVRQSILLPEPDMRVALGAERFFETLMALAQRGKVSRGGFILDPLQGAMTLGTLLLDPTWLPYAPRFMQRAMFAPARGLAGLLGYRAHHVPERDDDAG